MVLTLITSVVLSSTWLTPAVVTLGPSTDRLGAGEQGWAKPAWGRLNEAQQTGDKDLWGSWQSRAL